MSLQLPEPRMPTSASLAHPNAAHVEAVVRPDRTSPRLGALEPQEGPHRGAGAPRPPGPPALPQAALERVVAQCLAGSTRFKVSNAVLVWTPRSPVKSAAAGAAHDARYLRCGGLPHAAISCGAGDALDTLWNASDRHLLRLDDGGAAAAASPIVQAFVQGGALYLGDVKALPELYLRCVALAEAVIAGGRTFAAVPLWNPAAQAEGGRDQRGGRPQALAVIQLVLSAAHVPRRELLALVRCAAAAAGLACPDAIASWDSQTPPPTVVLASKPAAVQEMTQKKGAVAAAAAAKRAARDAALRAAALPPSQRRGAHNKVKAPRPAPAAPPLDPPLAGLLGLGAAAPAALPAASSIAPTEELPLLPTENLLPLDEDMGEASAGGGAGGGESGGAALEGIGSPSSQVLSESQQVAPRPGSARGGSRPGRRPRRAAAAKVAPELALETLKAHFGMDPAAAADQLGVSTAVLLKAARRHGIQRWPRPASAGARRGRSAGPAASQRSSAATRGEEMAKTDDDDDEAESEEAPVLCHTGRARDPRLQHPFFAGSVH